MTFREYMAQQASEAQIKLDAAKQVKGGISSTEVQELFRLSDIIQLNNSATA